MTKTNNTLKNRHGLSVVVEVSFPKNPVGLVFLQHGLSGCKEEPHIETMRNVFVDNHYVVVSIDSTHGLGESEGSLEHFTPTTHWQDLEDVIAWSKSQSFYQEPFILVGHSMGGFSTFYYACKNPGSVKAIAPISVATSGEQLNQAYLDKDPVPHLQWKERGWTEKSSRRHPDRKGNLSWKFFEDFFKYDLIDLAHELKIPALFAVGGSDLSTPLHKQKELFDLLDAEKELHVIPYAGHSFLEDVERQQLYSVMDQWIKKLAA